MLRNIVKRMIPSAARAQLRKLHRRWVWHRAIAAFRLDPSASMLDEGLWQRLSYGWGNEGWDAGLGMLRHWLKLIEGGPGPYLECGSGLSTVIAGIVAARHGRALLALEHNGIWAARVRSELVRLHIQSVEVRTAPLRDRGAYHWYDWPDVSPASCRFSHVLCDGPPGDTPGGRFGLLPCAQERLLPNANILVDDVERDAERLMLDRWRREFGGRAELMAGGKPYAVFTLDRSDRT